MVQLSGRPVLTRLLQLNTGRPNSCTITGWARTRQTVTCLLADLM